MFVPAPTKINTESCQTDRWRHIWCQNSDQYCRSFLMNSAFTWCDCSTQFKILGMGKIQYTIFYSTKTETYQHLPLQYHAWFSDKIPCPCQPQGVTNDTALFTVASNHLCMPKMNVSDTLILISNFTYPYLWAMATHKNVTKFRYHSGLYLVIHTGMNIWFINELSFVRDCFTAAGRNLKQTHR